MRVFDSRVLRKTFGPKRDEVTGKWRSLLKETLVICVPHQLGDQMKKKEMGGACSTYGERRGAYRVFVWKAMGKRLLGTPRRRCEDNTKMDFK